MVQWRRMRRSGNVSDRRGMSAGVMGGGIMTLVVIVVAMLFGVDPRGLLQMTDGATAPAQEGVTPPADDESAQFVRAILGSTEDEWSTAFREQGFGEYAPAELVLFDDAVRSACGTAGSAVGPFYCPADGTVYLDLNFFRELDRRFDAPGDFAQAYVVAHEVGHHIQNLLGIERQVRAAQSGAGGADANALQVRMELQADCLAGVWAQRANRRQAVLEPGDVEEGMRAAAAIGDDTLQRQAQGYVVPESFTHGTSAQRVQWLRRGLESGDPAACDAFAGSV